MLMSRRTLLAGTAGLAAAASAGAAGGDRIGAARALARDLLAADPIPAPGVRASLVVYPRQKLSIALAANLGAPDDVNGPSAKLADIFA